MDPIERIFWGLCHLCTLNPRVLFEIFEFVSLVLPLSPAMPRIARLQLTAPTLSETLHRQMSDKRLRDRDLGTERGSLTRGQVMK